MGKRVRCGGRGLCGAVALLSGVLLACSAAPALASTETLMSETFRGATTSSSNWRLPAAPSGSNVACLTAGSSSAPIPPCTPATDPAGSGALRLTSAATTLEGGIVWGTSVPTIDGLDATFDAYQYGSSNGADGISFFLAAANPSNPRAPAAIGSPGGDLGYSSDDVGDAGLTDGYLGVGLDVFGNYESAVYDGTGCTDPGWQGEDPDNVTVRGPGTGTVGYCLLNSTAATGGLSSGKLDGGAAGTRASSVVPVEVAINPTGSAITTASGLAVPAGSYAVGFTPVGGSAQSLTGTLPTVGAGLGFPAGWINPATGIPYQLSFGWAASTGSFVETHEVTNATVTSLSGVPPTLGVSMTDDASSFPAYGSTMDYDLSVSNATGATADPGPITVTDTIPSGETPVASGLGGTGWNCSITGQTVSCDSSSSLSGGALLPQLAIPVQVTAAPATVITNDATASSDDSDPAIGGDTVTVTKASTSFTASASPTTTTYGNAVTLSETGLPAGTQGGSVTFASGGSTLCAATIQADGSASCPTSSTLVPGTYSVLATYGGDADYQGSTGSTSFTITSSPALTVTKSVTSSGPYDAIGQAIDYSYVVRNTGDVPLSDVSVSDVQSFPAGALTSGPTCTVLGGPTGSCAGSTVASLAVGQTATFTATYDITQADLNDGSVMGTASALGEGPGCASSTCATTSAGSSSSVAMTQSPSITVTESVTSVGPYDALGQAIDYKYVVENSGNVTLSTASVTDTQSSPAGALTSGPTCTALASPTGTCSGSTVASLAPLQTATFTGTYDITGNDIGHGSVGSSATASGEPPGCSSGLCAIVSPSSGVSVTVTKAPTSLTASASPPTTTYGNAVTVGETGLPGATASETVAFSSGGSTLCPATIQADGSASCPTSGTLAPGTYTVLATYGGDADYQGSTGSTGFTITKATTTTQGTAAHGSITLGQTDTDAALVTGVTGGAGPTGDASFYVCGPPAGGSGCGTSGTLFDTGESLTPGAGDTSTAGSMAYTPNAAGHWCFYAAYGGDGNYAGSSDTAPTADCFTVAGPPSAQITSPAANQTYTLGQSVATSFSCTEGTDGPGLSSCSDSGGALAPAGTLDTSSTGEHTYTVTAVSTDRLLGTAQIDYAVTAPAKPGVPSDTVAPAITGTAGAGQTLTCSAGTWTNNPTGYAYQWSRDGTPLPGATGSTYAVRIADEGTTLSCVVTASNGSGTGAPATSASVTVSTPNTRCPPATGAISGRGIGPLRLGMTRAQASKVSSHSSNRGKAYEDFFCLAPTGIRVGYGSPQLLALLPPAEAAKLKGRVDWISTASPNYSLKGIRPGATLKRLERAMPGGNEFVIGRNDWYLAAEPGMTAVLKLRHGIVEEVGIADPQLTRTRSVQRKLMLSFG